MNGRLIAIVAASVIGGSALAATNPVDARYGEPYNTENGYTAGTAALAMHPAPALGRALVPEVAEAQPRPALRLRPVDRDAPMRFAEPYRTENGTAGWIR